MAKIQDIINAATPGPWSGIARGKNRAGVWANAKIGWVTDDHEFGDFCLEQDARFIATFNPQHIALMLKKDALSDDICPNVCEYLSPHTDAECLSCPLLKFLDASIALSDYRRERGLND